MQFIMDEQSYVDLNIFSTPENMFSIFELYKKTKTVGGRAKIEEMMRQPINNSDILTSRRDIIQFFSQTKFSLNIDHDQLDLIHHYLSLTRQPSRRNLIDSFFTYLRKELNPSQDDYLIKVGIKHLMQLLAISAELIPILSNKENPSYLIELAKRIKTIIDQEGLQYVQRLATKKKLRFIQLMKLDSIIRKKHKFDIFSLLIIFDELDAFETIAAVAKANNFCLPVYFKEENELLLETEGIFHPAIDQPVSNNISIDRNNNLIFLSGSNMSGKSSLLKSIGIAVYLAHIGFPIPAKKFATVVFNGLISTINLADSVHNGLSHYFSEVMRVKKIAKILMETKGLFVLMDELFKGTNAKDAFNASKLVINGFSAIQNSVFMISSHITELTGELEKATFMHLEHKMINEQPHFTYLLKAGISKDGIGMYFIAKENIAKLLDQAKSLNATSL